MRLVALHSTDLAAAGHEEGVLEVEFLDGTLYRYLTVPRMVFEELLVAHSAGRFFNARIKGRYPAERLR